MQQVTPLLDQSGASRHTCALVNSAISLARSLAIKTLVVQADEIRDMHRVETSRAHETSAPSGSFAN